MANIARLDVVATEWIKVEEAIEGFSPSADDKFEIQNIGSKSLQIYEGANAPTTERDGFVLGLWKSATYIKKADEYLFVRGLEGLTTLNIAEK